VNIKADNKTWLLHDFPAERMKPWKERGINYSRSVHLCEQKWQWTFVKWCPRYPTVYVYFGAEILAFSI